MVDHESEREGIEQSDALPDHIHGYRILGRLGRGGFADVYLACPVGSFRLVALKVLRAELDERVREQVRSRFHTEENIARAVDHPAVVEILATSPPGVTPAYIAMEYVDGTSFCEYFRRRPEPPDLHTLARLGHQVAEAMAAAHKRGIVHRDLKPDNVLVTGAVRTGGGARVRILDFGIAKAPPGLFARATDRAITRYVTELGTVMGSPPFMAPEQNGAAHAVSGKADVFALGMMLLVVVCRLDESEFYGANFVIGQPQTTNTLFALRPGLPAGWRALLQDMVALDHQQRPAMSEVARRLQRLAQPHEAFGAAVEAWLVRGAVPPTRRLRPLLSWAATASDLTRDEQRFLQQAPAARLPRRRGLAAAATLALPMVAAAGAYSAAVVVSPTVPLEASLNGAVAPVPSEPAAPSSSTALLPPSASSCDTPTTGGDVSEARAKLVGALEACRRAQQAERGTVQALRDKLEASESAMADLEIDVAEGRHRLESLQSELERSRETAAEQGKKAFACNQELESRSRQLEESMQRWRVCAKNRGAAAAQSPTADPTPSMPVAVPPPLAPSSPPES